MKQNTGLSLCAAAFLIWVSAGATHAQPKAGEHEAATITVTAQKQSEDIKDVPMSVQVFTGDMMDDAGIGNTVDLVRHTPNLHMRDSGSEHVIVIRGISSYNGSLTSPSGYYVDNIPYPLQVMHNSDFMDVERIEVLRGPQGTLYGKNSESGLIHVITRAPDQNLRGRIKAGYSSFNTWQGGFSLSGPLAGDTLFAGIQGLGITSDGFINNTMAKNDESGKKEHFSGRGRLRWLPSENLEIQLSADGLSHDDGYGIFRFYEGSFKTPVHEIAQDVRDQFKTEDGNGQSLSIRHSGSRFDTFFVAGRQDYEMKAFGDRFLFPMNNGTNEFVYNTELYTAELRVSSSPDTEGRLKWLVGISADNEDTGYNADVNNAGNELISFRRADLDLSSRAVFGQMTWQFTDRWFVTLGGRLDYQEVTGDIRETTAGRAYESSDEMDNTEFLPKLALRYSLSRDASLYAGAAKGFIAGGVNPWASLSIPESKTFDPEFTTNYEVGIKGSFFNGSLDLDASLFYIEIKDKQVSEMHVEYEQSVIRNVAEATSWGGELSLVSRPAGGWEVFGGIGFAVAEIDQWQPKEKNSEGEYVVVDYSGKKLQNVPEYTGNIGVQYRHPSGFMARAEILGVGKFYGDPKNTTSQEAHELVNAKIGWETETWDAYLWGKNLTDKEYATYVSPFGSFGKVAKDAEPMAVGVTLMYRF